LSPCHAAAKLLIATSKRQPQTSVLLFTLLSALYSLLFTLYSLLSPVGR
jgi:hypothetical protein